MNSVLLPLNKVNSIKKITFTKRVLYFFLFYWYVVVRYFFTNKKIIKNTKSFCELEKTYIKNKQNEFLKTSVLADNNSNIDSVFYNQHDVPFIISKKESLQDIIWKSKIIIENTYRGNIIMYYSQSKKGFCYYSNGSGIPYQLLNAICMKYVKIFKCFDFFLDENELKNVGINRKSFLDEITITENNKVIPVKEHPIISSSVFAKLKKNDIVILSGISSSEISSVNSFFYQGKSDKFNILQVQEKKRKNTVFPHSYLLYLNQCKSQSEHTDNINNIFDELFSEKTEQSMREMNWNDYKKNYFQRKRNNERNELE